MKNVLQKPTKKANGRRYDKVILFATPRNCTSQTGLGGALFTYKIVV